MLLHAAKAQLASPNCSDRESLGQASRWDITGRAQQHSVMPEVAKEDERFRTLSIHARRSDCSDVKVAAISRLGIWQISSRERARRFTFGRLGGLWTEAQRGVLSCCTHILVDALEGRFLRFQKYQTAF